MTEEEKLQQLLRQIEATAANAAGIERANKLADVTKWDCVGRDGHIVWGLIEGSNCETYKVSCFLFPDQTIENAACTCKSRLRPCKHSLALALLSARNAVPHLAVPGGHVQASESNTFEGIWE